MAKVVFTDTWLQSPKSIGEWYDEASKGLVIVRGKKGGGTWYVRVRKDGKYERGEPIGRYPAMSLAEARKVAASPLLPVAGKRSSLTIGSMLDLYERGRHGELKRLDARMRVLRNGFKDYLAMPFADFGENEMRAAWARMADGGRTVNGNRFKAYACAMFKWIVKEPGLSDTRNWSMVLRHSKETSRDRVLDMAELSLIWRATQRMGPLEVRVSYGRLIRFLMLTGQRLDEACSLKHGDILDGVWRQSDNKTSTKHQVPLSAAALVEVGSGEARSYVFLKNGSKWNNFDRYLRELREAVGFSDWGHHDLRRSMASHMGDDDLNVDPLVIESVLNHKLPGIMGTYQRPMLKKGKRDALNAWADYLTTAANRVRAMA